MPVGTVRRLQREEELSLECQLSVVRSLWASFLALSAQTVYIVSTMNVPPKLEAVTSHSGGESARRFAKDNHEKLTKEISYDVASPTSKKTITSTLKGTASQSPTSAKKRKSWKKPLVRS